MAIATPELAEITTVWPIVSKLLSVPDTPEAYEQKVKLLAQLVDEIGSEEDHPLASLMATLGALIGHYEHAHFREPTDDSRLRQAYPILEYDADPRAIYDIDLTKDALVGMPEHCVVCFFGDVLDHLAAQGWIKHFTTLTSETSDHPVYIREVGGRAVALLKQGVGASLAIFMLEKAIASGARKFIACGGVGVLDRNIAMGHVLVPTAAIRDEGTSYHYLPPSREVAPTTAALTAIETVLQRRSVDYLLTKTWTTDGIFRETRAKAAFRRAEGCLTVEMEAAALFAVAQFRQVQMAQMLYGGDNLDGDAWDSRGWDKNWTVREKLIELAIEACLEL